MALTTLALILAAASLGITSALACGVYIGLKIAAASAYALSPTKGKTQAVAPAIARQLIRQDKTNSDSIKVISPRKKQQNSIIVE